MSDSVSRDNVVAVARGLSEYYKVPFDDQRFKEYQATVIEGSHEGSSADWIISWEQCPAHDWVDTVALQDIVERVSQGAFYSEPINHFAVAFFLK